MYEMVRTLPVDWEEKLEKRLLQCQREDRHLRAYVCSPCRADLPQGVYRNMQAARYYMHCILARMSVLPCAPHAYLPTLLDDRQAASRTCALQFGQNVLALCNVVLVCGNALTQGIRQEIQHAAALGIPIITFCPDIFPEVQRIVVTAGASENLVVCNYNHPCLSVPPDGLFQMDEVS